MRNLEPEDIASKVQLLLDSSGDKLKLEKGHPVKSTTESVRGEEENSIQLRLNCMLNRDCLSQASIRPSTRPGKVQKI